MTTKGYHKAFFEGKDQNAQTPGWLWDLIQRSFFSPHTPIFDPCPPNATFDGLAVNWGPSCIVNPPFAEAEAWLEKAHEEWSRRQVRSVLILPLRNSAKYFHRLVFSAATDLVLLGNKVTFQGYEKAFPIPILLVAVGCTCRLSVWREHAWTTEQIRCHHLVVQDRKNFIPELDHYLETVFRFPSTTTNRLHCRDWQPTPSVRLPRTRQAFACLMGSPKEVFAHLATTDVREKEWVFMVNLTRRST